MRILDVLVFFRRGPCAPCCSRELWLDRKKPTNSNYRERNKYSLRKLCTSIPAGVSWQYQKEINLFWGQLSPSCPQAAQTPQCPPQASASGSQQPQPLLQSVEPLRRQQTCANSHQVEMRLEECETASVTLGFGLDNLELIVVETDSVSFCLLFQGGFIFCVKSGNGHCWSQLGGVFPLYHFNEWTLQGGIRGTERVWDTPLISYLEYVHTTFVAWLGQWLDSMIFPNLNDSVILPHTAV